MTLSKSSSLTALSLLVLRRHAGVVDEHVDAPEVPETSSTNPSSSSQWPTWQACAVARPPSARRAAATSLQTSAFRLTIHDLRSGLREPARDGEPEPARAAGDDGDAVGEVEAVSDPRGLSRLVQDGPPPTMCDAGEREGRDAVGAPVFGHLLADASGVQQQVEVPEHLPDDEQGLFGDRLLGHRLVAIVYAVAAPSCQRGDDALAAAIVLGKPADPRGRRGR